MSHAINELTGYADFNTTPDAKRVKAVAAALEVIKAKVANSPAYGGVVANEMDQLSKYADQIQAAIDKK